MRQSPLEKKIFDIVQPVIEELGFRLLYIKSFGEGGAHTIQVIAENPETGRLGIDDCIKISRESSALMDVDDPIEGRYKLEVSSPGIDRMLITVEDFSRYVGFEVKVETDPPLASGQKRFRGEIKGVDIEAQTIELHTDQNELVVIPGGSVAKAKLVMSDSLIKETANRNRI